MDKEELTKEHHFIQTGLSVGKAQSHADLTLEFAKQDAIGFAEWLSDHPLQFEPSSEKGCWIGLDFKIISSIELYSLYKSQVK